MNRYTVTPESVVVVIDGKVTTVKRGATNFLNLRKACIEEDWTAVRAHLKMGSSLTLWAKGHFTIDENDNVFFDGKPIPHDLNDRIVEMSSNGEDPGPLFRFWEKLQRNPSHRSVTQLWGFMKHLGIPLTEDGDFLAYKGVRNDFYDIHSGKFENKPGAVIKMPRNEISDDPDQTCHVGLHVGAREYAADFGPKVVIVRVNPENVVCVPNDYSAQKMRTCEYTVIGVDNGGLMPNTSMPVEDVPEPAPAYDGTKEKAPEQKSRLKKWARLDALNEEELMLITLDELRQYAFKGLKMVGVYRVAGGKLGLVTAIVKARQE